MSVVQWLTWVLGFITLGVILWVISHRRRYSQQAALKSVILLSVVVHLIVYYAALFVVTDLHNHGFNSWLMEFFHTDHPFSEWSAALRLHTIIAILNKETVSMLAQRIRKNGFH